MLWPALVLFRAQVRAKLDNLKAAWRLMSRLKGMPGFSWDDTTHRFMASGPAWVALIHQHPEFAGVQNKRAPWFPACDFIFGAIQESHKRPFTPEDVSSKTSRHKGLYGASQPGLPGPLMHAVAVPGQGALMTASPMALSPAFPNSPAPGMLGRLMEKFLGTLVQTGFV